MKLLLILVVAIAYGIVKGNSVALRDQHVEGQVDSGEQEDHNEGSVDQQQSDTIDPFGSLNPIDQMVDLPPLPYTTSEK